MSAEARRNSLDSRDPLIGRNDTQTRAEAAKTSILRLPRKLNQVPHPP